MPSFNDFINQLTEDKIKNIIAEAEARGNRCFMATENKDDIFPNQILAVSFTVAVEILREYHLWLSDYL